MVDIEALQKKLYDNQNLSISEAKELIAELRHFRGATAYLASCHAATAEGLTKSTSKSTIQRYADLCRISQRALQGDSGGIRHPESMESARTRCIEAERELTDLLQSKVKVPTGK